MNFFKELLDEIVTTVVCVIDFWFKVACIVASTWLVYELVKGFIDTAQAQTFYNVSRCLLLGALIGAQIYRAYGTYKVRWTKPQKADEIIEELASLGKYMPVLMAPYFIFIAPIIWRKRYKNLK